MIQFGRTEAQAAKIRAFYALTTELAGLSEDHPDFLEMKNRKDSEFSRDGVYFALESRNMIEDLKVTYIFNTTGIKFITSDNPVVLTNRLYLQRLRAGNFGVASAGATIFMPISDRIGVLLYDKDVYAIAQPSSRHLSISDEISIKALNLLTVLNAKTNLYSAAVADFDSEQIAAAIEHRITEPHIGRIAELVEESERGKFFRVVDKRPDTGGYLMDIAQHHPTPCYWPKFLKFRSGATAFSNGSGAGFVRRATVPPEGRDFMRTNV